MSPHPDRTHHSCGRQSGVTLVELLVTLVVGSIMVAAVYGTYMLVTKQYEKLSAVASLHQTGRAALGLMVRDIRQAGYLAFGESELDSSVNVVEIIDCAPLPDGAQGTTLAVISGCGRSDKISLIYDEVAGKRVRIDYSVQTRDGRGQLRTTKTECTDSLMAVCNNPEYRNQLIADYVEDLQFVGRNGNILQDSNPTVVDVELILRTRDEFRSPSEWINPSSAAGDSRLSANDGAIRGVFQQTVLVRNNAYKSQNP